MEKEIPMLLMLLALVMIPLVIIITASTDGQAIKGMRAMFTKQEEPLGQQALQAPLVLPELMVLQELMVLPELMVLQELMEQMDQQQPVPMGSRVEVEEFLS
jgi:hypothetical protein